MSELPEEAVAPRAIDLVHELHRAVYGDSWARPETPSAVWADLLAKVREMSGVPDPEPEWVPKVGDWYQWEGDLPQRIVDIANGYVAWHGRYEDGIPAAGTMHLGDLLAGEWEPCDPPEWADEVDTSASPGQTEVRWGALQNATVDALSPFSLGSRAELTARIVARVVGLLEAHGVEITDEPEEA